MTEKQDFATLFSIQTEVCVNFSCPSDYSPYCGASWVSRPHSFKEFSAQNSGLKFSSPPRRNLQYFPNKACPLMSVSSLLHYNSWPNIFLGCWVPTPYPVEFNPALLVSRTPYPHFNPLLGWPNPSTAAISESFLPNKEVKNLIKRPDNARISS